MKNLSIHLLLMFVFVFFACGDDSGKHQSDSEISNAITATITVRSLPEKLTVDLDSTPENNVEYGWAVRFDIDDDGNSSEGDIDFEIVQVKYPGDIEHEVYFQDLEAYVIVIDRDLEGKFSRNEIGPIDFETSDNTLTFIVDRDLSERLLLIDYQTQVSVVTFKSIDNQITSDKIGGNGFPGSYYSNVSDNRLIIDEENDYLGEDERFDILQFELEIVE